MTQLFLIIAFILGFALGCKVYELFITNGIAFLATQEDSGVMMDVENDRIIIDANILKKFNLNKENIN